MNNEAQIAALREEVDFLLAEETDRFEIQKEGLKNIENTIRANETNLVNSIKKLFTPSRNMAEATS